MFKYIIYQFIIGCSFLIGFIIGVVAKIPKKNKIACLNCNNLEKYYMDSDSKKYLCKCADCFSEYNPYYPPFICGYYEPKNKETPIKAVDSKVRMYCPYCGSFIDVSFKKITFLNKSQYGNLGVFECPSCYKNIVKEINLENV